ncbi:Lrp/AsnC family transcriptional regulator [Nocardia sp. JMUB6875]|uniref:Lrp/AsnC family transcriptional regulator n=1 Tax=Nocardia sp. JMUB6875 TaxID=3158170 RepID=UPI0032E727D7
MDSIDRAILCHLQRDARISNAELAQRVGLSPSPCLRRVRNLEEAGAITGYHARVDPRAIGRSFEVLVHANMGIKNRRMVESFEAKVAEFDEIVECRRMFGDPDYLLWIAVADADAYEQFFMEKLADLPGVARLHSQFTMKVVKTTGFPHLT